VRILMTVVQKFRTLKDKIPKIMDDAERDIEERVKRGEKMDNLMFDGGELSRLEPHSLVVEDATFDGDYHGDPLFILRDIQSLLNAMILRMRILLYYISTYSHHVDKEIRKANAAGEDRYPLPSFVTNRDNDEVFSATLKLTQGERDIISEFFVSGISCLKVFRIDVDPDEDPTLMKIYDKTNPSPKFREMCDAFAVIFTGLESHNFSRIVASNLPEVLEEIDKDSTLIGIFSSVLLDSRGVGKSHSYDLCAVLVPYILENFDVLGEYEEVPSESGSAAGDAERAAPLSLQPTNRANNLFKIFNLAFSSLMKHSKNEEVFLPHLQKLTAECLKGSTRGPFLVPNPYSNILRSMFRTISAGKFEE
jgi:transformation/transcription domain-associated protein